nr:hypothetical protein [Dubosiella newyorkensis]
MGFGIALHIVWQPIKSESFALTAKVSFACMSPTSSVNSQSVAPNICTTEVVGPVLKTYFELYPE